MRCGSIELRPLKAGDGGGVPGYQFDLMHCRDCDWQGAAIEFEDEVSWRAFVEARKDWRTETDAAA